jgi:hypothetical protein
MSAVAGKRMLKQEEYPRPVSSYSRKDININKDNQIALLSRNS